MRTKKSCQSFFCQTDLDPPLTKIPGSAHGREKQTTFVSIGALRVKIYNNNRAEMLNFYHWENVGRKESVRLYQKGC